MDLVVNFILVLKRQWERGEAQSLMLIQGGGALSLRQPAGAGLWAGRRHTQSEDSLDALASLVRHRALSRQYVKTHTSGFRVFCPIQLLLIIYKRVIAT